MSRRLFRALSLAAALGLALSATPAAPSDDVAPPVEALLEDLSLTREGLRFAVLQEPLEPGLGPAGESLDGDPLAPLAEARLWSALAGSADHLDDPGQLAFLSLSQAAEHLGISAEARFAIALGGESGELLTQLGEEMALLEEQAPSTPEPWRAALAQLVLNLSHARGRAATALEALGPQERVELVALLETGHAADVDLLTAGAILLAASDIDRDLLARAGIGMLVSIDAFLDLRPDLPLDAAWSETIPGVQGPALGPFPTAAGMLYVGSSEPNAWRIDDGIIVDLGGDDSYATSAATTALTGGAGLRVIVDLSGNDHYVGGAVGSPSATMLGIAALRDLAGNDTYEGKTLSQGAAVAGVGVLVDDEGDDTYRAGTLSQGAAALGLAVLADDRGDDRRVADDGAQGFGAVLGVGVLADRLGNDGYRVSSLPRSGGLFVGSQGSGAGLAEASVSGGVGVLWDGRGDDRYDADGRAQGYASTRALGILLDGSGDDRHLIGGEGLGAGHDGGGGILIDVAGRDVYLAGVGPAMGAGSEFGHGALVDLAGDDTYAIGGPGLGWAGVTGRGLLVDGGGDDRYVAAAADVTLGAGEGEKDAAGCGIFLDARGVDAYATGAGENGALWPRPPRSGGADRDVEREEAAPPS